MMRIALLLWASCCVGATAQASCDPRLSVPNVRQLTPWSAVEMAQGGQLHESIDVRVSATLGCPDLLLGAEVSPPEGHSIARVRESPNGAQIGTGPGSGLPLLALRADVAGELSIDPIVEWSAQGQAMRAGRQSLRVRWRLYAADALLPEAITELETLLQADVPAVLEVELISAGARQALAGNTTMLDFGEVASGLARDIDIEIRGNASAQLTIDRQWGELRLRERSEYTIPYTLLLDGRTISDASAYFLESTGDLQRARLSVVLGEVERRAAGVYEDILTVTVAPE